MIITERPNERTGCRSKCATYQNLPEPGWTSLYESNIMRKACWQCAVGLGGLVASLGFALASTEPTPSRSATPSGQALVQATYVLIEQRNIFTIELLKILSSSRSLPLKDGNDGSRLGDSLLALSLLFSDTQHLWNGVFSNFSLSCSRTVPALQNVRQISASKMRFRSQLLPSSHF